MLRLIAVDISGLKMNGVNIEELLLKSGNK
jgi:hypothetical protein